MSFLFGSLRISKSTSSGASLQCSAICRHTARNRSLLPAGSPPIAWNSWKSRITISRLARACLTAQSSVSNQAALSLWSGPSLASRKGWRLTLTWLKPASLISRKYFSWKRAFCRSFQIGIVAEDVHAPAQTFVLGKSVGRLGVG